MKLKEISLALLLFPWILPSCGQNSEPGQIVLLISVDTLRADHMSAYGYERITTPHLDRFFADGTIFDSAMSPAPCTVPAVKQFLRGSFSVNEPHQKTLAEILAAEGFLTAAVVSQHQFRKDGVDNYARGFQSFDMQGKKERDHHGMTTRVASEVSDRALTWLDETSAHPKRFLWLHYFDPHDPYSPPPGYRAFDEGNQSLRSGDRRSDLKRERHSPEDRWNKAGYIFSKEDVAHLRNLYDGEILYTDAQIGRVLDHLAATGALSSATVVLLSDHGERLGEGDLWDHCATLREEEIHVPLMIRTAGGGLRDGLHVSEPVSTLDVLPTVAELLGIALPPGLHHGESLTRSSPGRRVFSLWDQHQVIREGDWKLYFLDEPLELFDLSADPHEQTDLLATEPEVQNTLMRTIQEWEGTIERARELSEETRLQLKALGYIE